MFERKLEPLVDPEERASCDWRALGAILIAATAIRIAFLGQESFWRDESLTAYLASQSLESIFSGRVFESGYPSGQLVVAHIWMALVGTSDYALRLLPAIVGVLGVAAIYECGKRICGERQGLLAASLLTINPLHIHLSQEFRTYAALFLTATILLSAAVAFRRSGSKWAMLAWVATASIGMHLHYYAALPAIGLFLWTYATTWRTRQGGLWLAGNLVVAMAGLSLAPGVLADIAPHSDQDAVTSGAMHMAFTPLALLFGRSLAWRPDGVVLAVGALACSLAIWIGAIGVGWKSLSERGALVAATATPVGMALIMMLALQLVAWDDRKALVILPPLLVALAHGLEQLRGSVRRIVLCIIVVLSGIAWARYVVEPHRDEWRSIASYLDANRSKHDLILVAPDEEACSLRRYLSGSDFQRSYGDPIFGFDVDNRKFVEYLPEENEVASFPPNALKGAERVWLVYDSHRIATETLLQRLSDQGLKLRLLSGEKSFPRYNIVAIYSPP